MAAGATYEPIATQTLASAAATITFSSIAASWTDLRLIITAIGTAGNITITYNSDTATNYSQTILTGNGTAASSSRLTSQTGIFTTTGSISSTPTLMTMDIFSYAGSTNKTALSVFSGDLNGSGNVYDVVSLWRSTSAITRLDLTASFSSGTTATLYGIKAA